MKFLVVAFALVAIATSSFVNRELDSHWQLFKKTYQKEYEQHEELQR